MDSEPENRPSAVADQLIIQTHVIRMPSDLQGETALYGGMVSLESFREGESINREAIALGHGPSECRSLLLIESKLQLQRILETLADQLRLQGKPGFHEDEPPRGHTYIQIEMSVRPVENGWQTLLDVLESGRNLRYFPSPIMPTKSDAEELGCLLAWNILDDVRFPVTQGQCATVDVLE